MLVPLMWFTLSQAAARVNRSPDLLRRHIEEGRLLATRIGGTFVIAEEEIQRYWRDNPSDIEPPKEEAPVPREVEDLLADWRKCYGDLLTFPEGPARDAAAARCAKLGQAYRKAFRALAPGDPD